MSDTPLNRSPPRDDFSSLLAGVGGGEDDDDGSETLVDAIGAEVFNVVVPVAACIFITSALIQVLNPNGSSGASGVSWASAAYKEKSGDSDATKALGALENAAVFVAFISAVTFLLVVAFRNGFSRLIGAYMALSGFSIFAVLCGLISIQTIATLRLPVDALTFAVSLWNFAAVGTAALFVCRAPLTLRQGYLVAVGVATAFVFAGVPEWSTWALLGGMSAYDLWAVLSPTGPLKLLLDAASERGEEIPALVYEARPNSRRAAGGGGVALGEQQQRGGGGGSGRRDGPAGIPLGVVAGGAFFFSSLSALTGTMARRGRGGGGGNGGVGNGGVGVGGGGGGGGVGGGGGGGGDGGRGSGSGRGGGEAAASASSSEPAPATGGGPEDALLGDARASPPPPPPAASASLEQQQQHQQQRRGNNTGNVAFAAAVAPAAAAARRSSGNASGDSDDDPAHAGLPDGIKLGLGDFIFYSVLVGRASMYDGIAALSAALAVLAGLGATLLLLAVRRSALPALPISVALGALCTAGARFALEPVAMPLAGSMLFF